MVIAFVLFATVNGEPLDALTQAIHSAVLDQFMAAGLTAPTVAQLSVAIIKHYGPDPNIAIKNLYDRLQGPQEDFENDLTNMLQTLYSGADLVKFKTQIADKGGIKLQGLLRSLRIASVEGIPEQTIKGQAGAVTGSRVNIPPTDTAKWDGQFDAYAAAVNKDFNVSWNEADLAARTLAVFTGLPITAILDAAKEAEVKARIAAVAKNLGQNMGSFLKAALRRVAQGLQPPRVSAVPEIPSQIIDDQVRAFTRDISNPREDTTAWDTQFDRYARKINELFNANWSKAELAARTLADQTGLSVAMVLDPTQQGAVQTAINQASLSLPGFLDAAQRVAIMYPLEMLNEAKRKLEQVEQERDKLTIQLTKTQQELGLLQQEIEGLHNQRNFLIALLALTVVLAVGAAWLAVRRRSQRRRTKTSLTLLILAKPRRSYKCRDWRRPFSRVSTESK